MGHRTDVRAERARGYGARRRSARRRARRPRGTPPAAANHQQARPVRGPHKDMGRASLVEGLPDKDGGVLLTPRLEQRREFPFRLAPQADVFLVPRDAVAERHMPGVNGPLRCLAQIGGLESELQYVVARSVGVDGDRDVTVRLTVGRLSGGVRQVLVRGGEAGPYAGLRELAWTPGSRWPGVRRSPPRRAVRDRAACAPARRRGTASGTARSVVPVRCAAPDVRDIAVPEVQGRVDSFPSSGRPSQACTGQERESSAQGFLGRPVGCGDTLARAVQAGHNPPRHDRHLSRWPCCRRCPCGACRTARVSCMGYDGHRAADVVDHRVGDGSGARAHRPLGQDGARRQGDSLRTPSGRARPLPCP